MAQIVKYNIAKIIQRFLPSLEAHGALSGHQLSTLKLLSICKTAALGGHIEQCDKCGYHRVHYNSCSNRNCPSCQGVNKEIWLHARQQDLLPVKYFHSVFTIPSELYIFFRYNKKLLYDLLMKSVKDTLQVFGHDAKHGINGKIGGILLLHTWTQQLEYHPHIHVITPAGGITHKGEWKNAKSNGKFLFPVRALSKVFRGKLMEGIHQLYLNNELTLTDTMRKSYRSTKNKLYNKEWVVYSKQAFGGPEQVLEYLGRYTHKICISNYRILKITDSHVSFRYLDRKNKKSEIKTITGEAFIKLFAEHILPKRFVKIRHFGFLSSRSKAKDLSIARKCLKTSAPPPLKKMSTREFIIHTTGKDPYLCPCCNTGEMVIVTILPKVRGSPIRPPMKFYSKDRKINSSLTTRQQPGNNEPMSLSEQKHNYFHILVHNIQ